MKTEQTYTIHPEDHENIHYWSRKWRVSPRELNEAILQTGSLNAEQVKEYLKRDSWMHHPVSGTLKLLKTTVNFIF